MLTKLLAAVLGLFLALGLASSAAAYPVSEPDASVSNPVVEPGQGFTFFAEGFAAGSEVTITVGLLGGSGVVQTFEQDADSLGKIALPLTLSATGTYEIVASGINPAGEAFSVTSQVQVAADGSGNDGSGDNDGSGSAGVGSNGSSAGGTLARTGVDNVATVAWAAFGVLVLGGLLVAVASGRGRTRESV